MRRREKWGDDAEKWRDEEGNEKRVIGEGEGRTFEFVSRTIRARRRRNGIFRRVEFPIVIPEFSLQCSRYTVRSNVSQLLRSLLLFTSFCCLTHSLSLSYTLIPCSLFCSSRLVPFLSLSPRLNTQHSFFLISKSNNSVCRTRRESPVARPSR